MAAVGQRVLVGGQDGVDEALPGFRPQQQPGQPGEHQSGGRGADEHAPLLRNDQGERNENAEVRLEGEEADQDAGQDRTALHRQQRAAEQRRGDAAVLPNDDVGEQRQKRRRPAGSRCGGR